MREKVRAIEVDLKKILQRIEKLRNIQLSYEVLAKTQKVKLKIDELSDLISEMEGMGE